jgi:hypothetical protein
MSLATDAIGEHYCLSELLLAGKEAYLANGKTQEDWDIVVFGNNEVIRVQVKCTDLTIPSSTAIQGMFIKKGFDYLVIVVLNFNSKNFTYYVIPYEKLKEKKDGERYKLIDNEGHVYFSKRQYKKNKSGQRDASKGYEKQTISFSTIKKQSVQNNFKQYLLKFEHIVPKLLQEIPKQYQNWNNQTVSYKVF